MSKKEREICEFEMDLKYFFSIRSNLSNEGQVWKRVWKITFFLVWNRGSGWITRQHTPTKNSQKHPPGPRIA